MVRPDKTVGNFIKTVANALLQLYENLTQEELLLRLAPAQPG